ncbi:MAG TPA: CopD family protein [Nitrosopumilaceae archaeon]|nr:CopD family protein [Nitrosopumilaceae archaeon]
MKKFLFFLLFCFSIGIPLAEGHPFTIETNPPQASNVPVGLTRISVQFSEAIDVDFSELKVYDSNGVQIDNKDTSYFEGDNSLVVTTPPLQDGVYTVTSKVLSKVDGHLVPGAFVFAVGDVKIDPSLLEQHDSAEIIFFPEAGARIPGFVGQTIVLGGVISSLLIWRTQQKKIIKDKLEQIQEKFHSRYLSIIGIGIIAVFISNILMLVIQTLRLEVSAFDAIQTSFGTTWIIRMAITIGLLGVWFWIERKKYLSIKNQFPPLILSLALIGTSTMIGHGAASEQVPAIVLDYVHNLIASIWIGGIIFFGFILLPTFSILEDKSKELFSLAVIPRFSIMIIISLGVLIISGPTLLWFLESNVGLLVKSTYGNLILIKIAIASIMIGLGGYNQFVIQKKAENNLKSGIITVHKKLRRSLKIESILGIILLGVVALLTNGTLPAGEIQQVQAEEIIFGYYTTEFSEHAKFDVTIYPYRSGQNTISVIVSDLNGNSLDDIDSLKIKVSNPQRNISPIEIPLTVKQDEKSSIIQYEGELTFGFSGKWQIEIEAKRTTTINEDIILDLLVKPKLTQIKTEITEYPFPSIDSAPLYPLFDGKNSIWISDPSKPRLWKFTIDDKKFSSYEFEGLTSIILTQDNNGNIWFTDTPNNKIGFIDSESEQIQTISLPMKSIPISLQADLENNIWVSLVDKNMIIKYDQNSGKFEEHHIPTAQGGPFALARDSYGDIWFTESNASKIGVINPKTGKIKEFASDFPIESPEALYFDREGMLWITAHTGLALVKFNPVLETFERISISDPNALPFGMTEDKYGNIWFAQHTTDNIAIYDPQNNNLIEIPISTKNSFIQFMTSDNNENIWFVEQRGNKLGMIKISEIPSFGDAIPQIQDIKLQYAELVSPFIAIGIIATSLFFVKSVTDKRRLDSLIP